MAALQDLLDRSMAAAGPHLTSIITPERRLTAEEVARRLTGMCLLALATITAGGRPEWETFLDSGPVYARIDAAKMFTFHMAREPPAPAG